MSTSNLQNADLGMLQGQAAFGGIAYLFHLSLPTRSHLQGLQIREDLGWDRVNAIAVQHE